MTDNGTVTYLYRDACDAPWQERRTRARITPKRIFLLPRAYNIEGKRVGSSHEPRELRIIAYCIDGGDLVIIDKAGA